MRLWKVTLKLSKNWDGESPRTYWQVKEANHKIVSKCRYLSCKKEVGIRPGWTQTSFPQTSFLQTSFLLLFSWLLDNVLFAHQMPSSGLLKSLVWAVIPAWGDRFPVLFSRKIERRGAGPRSHLNCDSWIHVVLQPPGTHFPLLLNGG